MAAWRKARPSALLLLVCVPACSTISGYPASSQDEAAEIAANQKYFAGDVAARARAASDIERGGLDPQSYRDAVIYGRLNVIDIRYYQFERELSTANNSLSLATDLAALALGGLGATVGGASAKAALAAASAGVVGARAAVNTDLFYQRTLPALTTQMRAARQTALYPIRLGLTQPISQYSLDQALTDIQAYYVAGTLQSAVTQVTAQASIALDRATQSLSLLRSTAFVTRAPEFRVLLDRVSTLQPDEATSVLRVMISKLPERSEVLQRNLKLRASSPERLTGVAAKQFLSQWVSQDERSDASAREWDAALASVHR